MDIFLIDFPGLVMGEGVARTNVNTLNSITTSINNAFVPFVNAANAALPFVPFLIFIKGAFVLGKSIKIYNTGLRSKSAWSMAWSMVWSWHGP